MKNKWLPRILIFIGTLLLILSIWKPVEATIYTFRILRPGINILGPTSDPSVAKAGDMYFNSSTNSFRAYNGSGWSALGSGGGGGLNFVPLDTSFASTKPDNSTAETSTGDWATYSGGTTDPTSMTGGTATQLTLSRTTTAGEVLDGSGSF